MRVVTRAFLFMVMQMVVECASGSLVHVSTYAHLTPKRRPEVQCQHCDERVTLALGKIQIHHARHRGPSDCPLAGESAVHAATKTAIAGALSAAGNLVVSTEKYGTWWKPRCKVCDGPIAWQLAAGWTEVAIEHRIGPFDADVCLLREGEPITVIEVVHTSAVSSKKAAFLRERGIPWVEVDCSVFDGRWTADQRLHISYATDIPIACRRYGCGRYSLSNKVSNDHATRT